jgi:uncharacterized protein YjbI with pentapeptide repeats
MSKRWIIPLIIVSAIALLVVAYFSATAWGKTLWDWLELLVVPIVLALVAVWFSAQERTEDRTAADKRTQIDREIATDRLQDATLQAYYDKMTELLLKENLRDAPAGAELISIARSRTRATLRSLDNVRKGLLVEFLHESRLIDKQNPIILLEGADLTGAELMGASLSGANLSGANLAGANLSAAILSKVKLIGADLSSTDLSQADLSSASLSSVILSNANLTAANLTKTSLVSADLKDTNLKDALLDDAVLRKATSLEPQQLARAASLKGAILPDGTVYDPATHPEINYYRQQLGLPPFVF